MITTSFPDARRVAPIRGSVLRQRLVLAFSACIQCQRLVLAFGACVFLRGASSPLVHNTTTINICLAILPTPCTFQRNTLIIIALQSVGNSHFCIHACLHKCFCLHTRVQQYLLLCQGGARIQGGRIFGFSETIFYLPMLLYVAVPVKIRYCQCKQVQAQCRQSAGAVQASASTVQVYLHCIIR